MTKDTLSASLGNLEANYPSSTPTPTINTPPSGESSPRPRSRKTSPFRPSVSFPAHKASGSPAPKDWRGEDYSDDQASDAEDEDMVDKESRPHFHRPTTDGRSSAPLLKDEGGRISYDSPNGSARPPLMARKSTFRSRSPDLEGSRATKKKYTYAAFFLIISLISFVIQTETAVYIQDELKWKKAYCMLYVTMLRKKWSFMLTHSTPQDTLLTVPGLYYGLPNFLSCGFEVGGHLGEPSGANTSTSSGLQRRWLNLKISI